LNVGFLSQRGNGTGGESIYGEKFADENFRLKVCRLLVLFVFCNLCDWGISRLFSVTAHWPGRVVHGQRWSRHQRLSVLLVHCCGEGRACVCVFSVPWATQLLPVSEQTPWLDGKHVVFGNVTKGMDVVKAVEGVGSESGRTRADVVVADCGQLA
jgi:cyclophilin family peptidyl-prolyl cis-trans isomerase